MWRKRVHVSWLIALACGAFVVGVWLTLHVGTVHWVVLPPAAICLIVSFRWKILVLAPLLCFGAIAVGVLYGQQARGELDVYDQLVGKQIELTGRVREDPTHKDEDSLTLQLDQLKIGGHPVGGVLWASTRDKADVLRGDRATVVGTFDEPFGSFAAVMYKAEITRVERPVPGDVGRVVRDWFAGAVREGIPEPQASLGIGYLTGQKSALPSDLAEALQIAGLTHIVVASGYNLTILVRLARRLFARISKYLSTVASAAMIIGFVGVTGLSPSMTRAGLVAGLSLAAWYYGRAFHPFVLLPFAAAITVLWQPSYVWGDMGWQLSFAAFAGVMIVAPLMQRFFFGQKPPGMLRQVLGETMAAHVVTIPIVVPAFGVLSNVAIPANLLIVPLVPLAMLLTFITGITGLVAPVLAEFIGSPATWLLTYMTETATFLAGQPWAQMELVPEWWMTLAYVVVLVVACLYMWRATRFNLRSTNLVD